MCMCVCRGGGVGEVGRGRLGRGGGERKVGRGRFGGGLNNSLSFTFSMENFYSVLTVIK